MKVLHLSFSDLSGGAARAAFRLHNGLKEIDVKSSMMVQEKLSNDRDVIAKDSRSYKLWAKVRPHLDAVQLRRYRNRKDSFFSPAILPGNTAATAKEFGPDIIHLHWITKGFLNVESLKRFKDVPIVWTLHDSWPFTGGCHVPFDCVGYKNNCGCCPALGSSRDNDLSRRTWNRKQRAWSGLDITIVTPSEWLAKCARSSSLFKTSRVEVIPNGLDTAGFKPICKNVSRDALSLPRDRKIVLFGAVNSLEDKNKGFHYLASAMRELAVREATKDFLLVVFGAPAPENPQDLGVDTNYLGNFSDEVSLALLYSAADVFVAPSIQENLSNSVMESLSCGTPVVAFNIGGMPDMISHKHTGYLAKPYEEDDLAGGIAWILDDKKRWGEMSSNCRQRVVKEYEISTISKRYTELYNELV